MFPFAWLMGLDVSHAFQFAQFMGMKLVTNEFVVMGKIAGTINNLSIFPAHYQAQLTVFITSFANFSTTGMIIGAFKGLVDKEKNDLISKKRWYNASFRYLGIIDVCRNRWIIRLVIFSTRKLGLFWISYKEKRRQLIGCLFVRLYETKQPLNEKLLLELPDFCDFLYHYR